MSASALQAVVEKPAEAPKPAEPPKSKGYLPSLRFPWFQLWVVLADPPGLRQDLLDTLMSFGFSRNRSIRGLMATKNMNVDAALNWITAKLDDPIEDFVS